MNNVLKFTAAAKSPSCGAENAGSAPAPDCGKVLEIRLMGKLDIVFQGQRLVLPTRHAGLLIAVLALEGRMQRETLAARFWGERGDAQARASLRQTIYHANKGLALAGAPALEVDRRSIGLKRGTFRTDAVRLLEDLESDPIAAAGHCTGQLLGSIGRVDPAFQEWLDIERRAFAEKIARRLESASAACLAKEDWTGLETLASRRLDLDPYSECALRHRMEALSKTGQRSAALVLFEEFRQRLQSSLQVEPEGATVALRRRIAARCIGNSEAETPGADRPALPVRDDTGRVALLGTTHTFVICNLAERVKTQPGRDNLVEEIVRCGSEQLREQASQSIADLLRAQRQS